jgi:tetratricopeptide (TPR) repeat protein
MERPRGEAQDLEDQAAFKVSELITQLRDDIGDQPVQPTPTVLTAFLKAEDLRQRSRGASLESREAFRRLTEVAPNSARAHIGYAETIGLSTFYLRLTDDQREFWRREAEAHIAKARALAPKDGRVFIALMTTAGRFDWPRREALLDEGLALSPHDPQLTYWHAGLLRELGYTADAIQQAREALILQPASSGTMALNIFNLAGVGRYAEARQLQARAKRLMPTAGSTRRAIVHTAILYAPPAEAEAALAEYQTGAAPMEPGTAEIWRTFIAARTGRTSKAEAARAIVGSPVGETMIDVSTAISALAILGDDDDAFDLIEVARRKDLELHTSNLFDTATAALRAEPRFMRTAARLGLAGYWSKTGRWPDFCAEPGLPYDCKAEAAKALSAPPSP